MNSFIVGSFSALWLGILTSISPCPLATNIAAISYISRDITRTRMVFLSGVLYSLGRMLAYVVVAGLLVTSILSIPHVSYVLQKYMNKILGPFLIAMGMILLELIVIKSSGPGVSEKIQRRAGSWGIWGAGILGVVFALSFCPVSAALFFGSLIPLSVEHSSSLVLPGLYGLGTGLPVFVFAALIALGAQKVAVAFNRVTQVEIWLRRITGAVFIVIGIYFCLTNIFHVLK